MNVIIKYGIIKEFEFSKFKEGSVVYEVFK